MPQYNVYYTYALDTQEMRNQLENQLENQYQQALVRARDYSRASSTSNNSAPQNQSFEVHTEYSRPLTYDYNNADYDFCVSDCGQITASRNFSQQLRSANVEWSVYQIGEHIENLKQKIEEARTPGEKIKIQLEIPKLMSKLNALLNL